MHFITFTCFRRLPLLRSVRARNIFVQILGEVRDRYGFSLVGYVVMPEHGHLLLSEPRQAALSKILQAIKLSVTVQHKERPFWQDRYYDFNVYTERKRVEKLRYMHRNPVVRGLAVEPDGWAWSSFHHYATGEPGRVEIESPWTAARGELAVQ